MVAQTVDDELCVQTVVNAAGTKFRISSNRIWPGVLDAKNRATESFVRSTDRRPADRQTREPQPGGRRGDDADVPLHGDADGSGGV